MNQISGLNLEKQVPRRHAETWLRHVVELIPWDMISSRVYFVRFRGGSINGGVFRSAERLVTTMVDGRTVGFFDEWSGGSSYRLYGVHKKKNH